MSQRKTLRRMVFGVVITLLALFGGGVFILHSAAFRALVLTKVIESVQERAGLRIDVANMHLSWSPFSVEFDDLYARSQSAITRDPLFSAARVSVSLKLLPLLHRRLEIKKVDIDQPDVFVRTDAHGHNNLPTIPNTPSSGSSFETQIAMLIIRNGVISYDNRQIPLSAELRNFHTQIALDRLTNAYKGEIAYDAGRIATPGVRTFEHSARLQFVADATHCVVERLDVAAMHTHVQAHGNLTDYQHPMFTGDYQATVSAEDLRWVTENPFVPSGELSLQGGINYHNSSGQTFLQQTYLDGRLESAALIVPANQSTIALKSVRGRYRLEHGELHVDGVTAETLGGYARSDSDVVNLQTKSGQIRLMIRGIALQRASQVLNTAAARSVHVVGQADMDIGANWQKGTQNTQVKVHAVIRSGQGGAPSNNIIPVDGVIDVDYDAARVRAAFGPSTLRANSTQLTINGVVSNDSALNLHLASSDLHELSALVDSLILLNGSNRMSAYGLHGAADFTGKLSGAAKDAHLEGLLTATNLQVQGTKWQALHTHIGVDPHSVKLGDGSLVGVAKERINFDARAQLANWSLDPAAPISVHTRIQNLSAAELQRLGQTSYPVSGVLNGELFLTGSERAPVGHGHLDLVHAAVWNEPLNAFNVDFNADKQAVHVTGEIRAAAGVISAKGTYEPTPHRYQLQLNTKNLKLEQVQVLRQNQEVVAGQLTADISGSGTLDDPGLKGRIDIPSLQVRGETLTGVDAEVNVQHKRADVTLRSTVEQNTLQVQGGVDLGGEYPAKFTLDTGVMPIGPLMEKFMPGRAPGASGQVELHATLDGPLKEPGKIQGHAEIPTIRLQTKSIGLSNANAIVLDYHSGVLRVLNAELKGNGTDVRVTGSVPIQGTGDMDVTANGTLDLGLLQEWTNGGHSSGQVNVELQAKGKKADPMLQGRVRIVNAFYNTDDLPVGIESLNGDITMDGKRLQIANLSGTAGGGTFSVGGSAIYGANSSFNLGLEASSVRLRQNGVRAVIDANLSLSGATNASTLGGRVSIHKLSFNQGSDLGDILSQLSGDNTVSDPSSFAANTKLHVSVESAEDLSLASSQLSIAGSANLNVMGTLADPVILGRVALTSGEVFFLGKRLEIQSGTIAFGNTVRTEPVVNLSVSTVVDQYTITINLNGPIDGLKTSYTSDPSLSTADIINLLAFGQTTANAASSASTPASVGAESAVASAAGSQVASQVQKLTGISQLSFNPMAGNNQNPGSQVAIQQRVSGNIFLTFSTDITSAQNQSIQVQYQAKRHVTVSVLRDENGGYGFDVRYHKAF
jgi:translocation and assembly module TamB